MSQEHRYIEERDGSYYLRGHRIPLITIMHVWFEGSSPESIQRSFPTLSSVEIYGGILYYLENREALDRHFIEYRAEEKRIGEQIVAARSEKQQEFHRRLQAILQRKEQSAS